MYFGKHVTLLHHIFRVFLVISDEEQTVMNSNIFDRAIITVNCWNLFVMMRTCCIETLLFFFRDFSFIKICKLHDIVCSM